MRQFVFPIAVAFCIAIICNGCQSQSAPASATQVEPVKLKSTLDAVRGTVRLREGVAFPAGATLRVVAQWYDTKQGEQVIEPGGKWPVAFAVPIDWPMGKGAPSYALRVHARAEVDGRAVMVSQAEHAEPPGAGGRPVELELFPAIE